VFTLYGYLSSEQINLSQADDVKNSGQFYKGFPPLNKENPKPVFASKKKGNSPTFLGRIQLNATIVNNSAQSRPHV
jgi:hypothetical protein